MCKPGLGVWGNTPTGVGKTNKINAADRSSKKHPHGRGEDRPYDFGPTSRVETPPRAWGRLATVVTKLYIHRNTPTGVGKTLRDTGFEKQDGKHPHGRGEDKNYDRKKQSL